MLPPIPLGTVLRQRYVIQQILGQGGFSRTYLALDEERFKEPCVLKEFTVPYQDAALIEKSKLLFQREANTLHQIQHPQIPRFWAAFEDNQRLFLVQSYVEGKTYRRLLSDRKQQGLAFSESEVLHLLKHLMPVLVYLHEQDILHRDISPDNIILQTRAFAQGSVEPFPEGGLPVLIDFGAVKEAANHWPRMSIPLTRVGKVGYAPPEQLQTGKVYRNSDLYSVAATSLALLTGREPRTLLNSQTLTWHWQPHANISPELGAILSKMLAVYPGDRYPSAQAVLADLQPLLTNPPARKIFPRPPRSIKIRLPRYPKRYKTIDSPPPRLESTQASTKLTSSLTGTYPLLVAGMRTSLVTVLLVGLGMSIPIMWRTLVKQPDSSGDVWVSGAKLPQSEASRIIASQQPNTSNSTLDKSIRPSLPATPSNRNLALHNSNPPQLIRFAPGAIAATVQSTLKDVNLQPYLVKAVQGQVMTVILQGTDVVANVLRSDQKAVNAAAYQTRSWTGQIPATDQYVIQVVGSGSYSLEVAMTPLARPNQDPMQRITWTPGTGNASVTGNLAPNQSRRYLLEAKQGQMLAMRVLQGSIRLGAIAPNGQRLFKTPQSKTWRGRLPMDGEYVIEITALQSGEFSVGFEAF